MAFWKSKQKSSDASPADEPDRFDQTAEIEPVQYDDDDDDDDGDEKTQLLQGPRPTAAQIQQAIRRSSMGRDNASDTVTSSVAAQKDWEDEATAIGRSILPRMSHPSMAATGRASVDIEGTPKPPRLTPDEEFDLGEEDVEDDFSAELSTSSARKTTSAPVRSPTPVERLASSASAPETRSSPSEASSRRLSGGEHRAPRARVEIPIPEKNEGLEDVGGTDDKSRDLQLSDDILAKASTIELIAFDVDGTLTDGGLFYGVQGEVLKRFNVHDGHGIVLAKRAGLQIALLTARNSQIVKCRAKELGIELVFQGQKDKVAGFQALLAEADVSADRVAYMGDDLNDLGALLNAGISACPSNACRDVQNRVDFVSTKDGGCGAARELIEVILKAQGKWDALVEDAAAGK